MPIKNPFAKHSTETESRAAKATQNQRWKLEKMIKKMWKTFFATENEMIKCETIPYLASDTFPNKIHRRRELWSHQQINLYICGCGCAVCAASLHPLSRLDIFYFYSTNGSAQHYVIYVVICIIVLLLLLLLSLLFMNSISNKSLRFFVHALVCVCVRLRPFIENDSMCDAFGCDKMCMYTVLLMCSCRLTPVKWLKSILFLVSVIAGLLLGWCVMCVCVCLLTSHISTSHRCRAL